MTVLHKLLCLTEKGRLVTGPNPKPKPDFASCRRKLEQEITAIVAESNSDTPRDNLIYKLTAVYNRAALMEYHFGDFTHAENLCHKAIALCAADEHSRSKLWLLAILQPQVNLARIASAKGNWIEALEILDRVFDFTERGGCLQLGGCLLDESKKPAGQPERQEIKDFGRAVFIADSLRALLLADRPNELVTFAEASLQTDLACNREFWMMLAEARTRGLLALGGHQDALALLREMLKRMSVSGRIFPAIYCVLAEIYAATKDTSYVQSVILRADQMYTRALAQSGKDSTALNFLTTLAFSQIEHGLYETGRANARTAIDLADRLQDEGGKLKAMALFIYSGFHDGCTSGADTHLHVAFCNLLLST